MASELILVVEDNEKNRKLVRDVLTVKGYEVIEAETGEEGVRLAHELHPDLILMDIQLPGIDGATGLRQLRGDPATRMIPALAVTASAMIQDRQTIMAAGFEGYQSKLWLRLLGRPVSENGTLCQGDGGHEGGGRRRRGLVLAILRAALRRRRSA